MGPKPSELPQRRSILFVGAVFLVSAAFFWWWLPAAPRFTLGGRTKVRLLDVSPDGSMLAVAHENHIQLWKTATGQKCGEYALPDQVHAVHAVFTGDSQRLVANCYQRGSRRSIERDHHWASIYRVGATEVEAVLPLGSNNDDSAVWLRESFREPTGFRVSPDGQGIAYLASREGRLNSEECVLRVWELASGQAVTLEETIDGPLWSPLAYSPDGRFVAAGVASSRAPYQIKVWELATKKVVQSLTIPPQTWMSGDRDMTGIVRCRSVAFMPDGNRLLGLVADNSATLDDHIFCWDLGTGALRSSVKWDDQKMGGGVLRASRNGKHVLAEGIDLISPVAHLCDLSDAAAKRQESFDGNLPVLSHDGKSLAVGSHRSGMAALLAMTEPSELQVVDLATSQRRTLQRETWLRGHLYPLAFAPDDKSLVMGCGYWSPTLYVVDVERGWRQAQLKGKEARFAADGKSIVTYEQQQMGTAMSERLAEVGEILSPGPGQPSKPQSSGKKTQSSVGNILGSGMVRVYDHPTQPPILSIIVWAMLPMALTILVRRWWVGRRSANQGANGRT